jgi:HAD superfamily hydrolase (TIGR01549 family)
VIEGVVFDLGSTLIRFTGDWQLVFEDGIHEMTLALTQNGLDLDTHAFHDAFVDTWTRVVKQRDKDYIERPITNLLHQVLEGLGHGNLSSAVIDEAIMQMFSVSEYFWLPMPKVHAVLEELETTGLRMGIVSNASNAANVQRLVDNAELRPYFNPIVVSAEQGVRKPDPRIFDPVLQAWGLQPQRMVMIGDNLAADILGARQLGMFSIWLTAEANTRENKVLRDRITPDAVADRLDEIPEIIRDLNSKA